MLLINIFKQWMQCIQSRSETDYIYYPIEYTSDAFSTILTLSYCPADNICVWAILKDKSKFLNGIHADIWEFYTFTSGC